MLCPLLQQRTTTPQSTFLQISNWVCTYHEQRRGGVTLPKKSRVASLLLFDGCEKCDTVIPHRKSSSYWQRPDPMTLSIVKQTGSESGSGRQCSDPTPLDTSLLRTWSRLRRTSGCTRLPECCSERWVQQHTHWWERQQHCVAYHMVYKNCTVSRVYPLHITYVTSMCCLVWLCFILLVL